MFYRQARKLQEMFQKVQQENEMLRSGRRPGNAIQMGSGSGQQFNDLLSPAHNMRHQSNAPGSGRVVCLFALQIVHTSQLPAAWRIATSTHGRMLCKASTYKAIARHQHTKNMLLWCIGGLYMMANVSSLNHATSTAVCIYIYGSKACHGGRQMPHAHSFRVAYANSSSHWLNLVMAI